MISKDQSGVSNHQKRALSRRDLLRGAGAIGLGTAIPLDRLVALHPRPTAGIPEMALPVLQGLCTLTPSLTEGPYYVNVNLVRRDIREGRPGLTMYLFFQVVRAADCTPIAGAAVDIWHCDSGGLYSSVPQQQTSGQTFMRGIQITDVNGLVRFDTIYPGYYPGRTTHIHVKVHPVTGGTLTSQTYFPDNITDLCYQLVPPYSSRPTRTTRNSNDGIYRAATQKIVLANPDGTPTLISGLRLGI
jgi:protocatechuate 3,4-dioxygenase beta subunit